MTIFPSSRHPRRLRLAEPCLLVGALLAATLAAPARAELQAGAAVVDVSPQELPALRNGGFLEASYDRVLDPLHARAICLSDGTTTLAIVIVDSCMIPRDVCDEAKRLASQETGIPTDRIAIGATHTHSAPSVMDFCLGTRKDEAYTAYLPGKIAEAIAAAHAGLRPARAAWAAVEAPEYTNCRRWIVQPDALQDDPFGNRTVKAMMHPGYQNPRYQGPAGPVDTQLSLLSLRTPDGAPIAILANFSMHYFGIGGGFSADYFGRFCNALADELASEEGDAKPVVALSQGTSGDLHWMDYSQPRKAVAIDEYAAGLARVAAGVLAGLDEHRDVDLAMAETRLVVDRRVPDADRLAWARKLNEARGHARPRNRPEVYAEQAVFLHENPRVEIALQAIRVGDLGIATLPNEVFGVTGLKLKARSPLTSTFNLGLTNGAAGYIPPPEQHALGGYTTWPARTAGLAVQAEPRIVDELLTLLEKVSGKERRAAEKDLYGPAIRSRMEKVGVTAE